MSTIVFPLAEKDVAFRTMLSHEGKFGAKRKHDIHTGVDLYTVENAPVFAMEDGVVLSVVNFTGPPESPWWLPTMAVMVEGNQGVLLYGEVAPLVREGETVFKGQHIASVLPVLPEDKIRTDIQGHSRFMLHLEWYEHGTSSPVWWELNQPQPVGLLDPTPLIVRAWNERSVKSL